MGGRGKGEGVVVYRRANYLAGVFGVEATAAFLTAGDYHARYNMLYFMAQQIERSPLAYEALIGSGLTPLEAAKILVADD